MWFLDWIIQDLTDVKDFFYDAYQEVSGWVWPFYYLADPLYGLYRVFRYLVWDFEDFNNWVDDVASKIGDVLSFSSIYSYFSDYFDAALDAWEWVRYAWGNVWDIVDDWWYSTSQTVRGWIENAAGWLEELIYQAETWLAGLQSAWDSWAAKIPSWNEVWSWWGNWWGNILAQLDLWWKQKVGDISGLVDTAIKNWAPVLDSWQTIYTLFGSFFEDPFGWIQCHIIEPIVDDFNKGFDRGMKGE